MSKSACALDSIIISHFSCWWNRRKWC